MVEVKEAKRILRHRMLNMRRMMAERKREICSQRILAKLYREYYYTASHCLMCYASTYDEVQLGELFKQSIFMGKTVCLPHIVGTGVMEAVKLSSLDDLEKGAYGIMTVKAGLRQIVPSDSIDLVLVPGVAFTRQGGRLGMGSGYYDRFLSSEAKAAYRIALSFDCQIVEEMPLEVTDVLMDKIITETETIITSAR